MPHLILNRFKVRSAGWVGSLVCTLSIVASHASGTECSAKFRQLVAAIHRPAFEWSASLPESGTRFRWAQVKGYLYLAGKMLRPPKPVDANARQKAIKTVDIFFDEVIKGYPESTQAKLKSIYYQNANRVFTKGYYSGSQNLANWHVGKNGIEGFSVEFDESFRDSELLLKLILIHECAVHIGQMDQRLGQVGAAQLAAEHATQDAHAFTEMSAALAEKTVMSAIDFSVVEAETNRITDPIVRFGTLGMFYLMNQMPPKQYIELLHRREALVPSPAQVEEFLREPSGP